MTIKQVIARLQNLKSMEEFDLCTFLGVYYKGIKDDYDEALQMAIEAISAQPEPSLDCEKCMMEHTDEMEKLEAELAIAKSKQPEPCEDAISRQAAIESD